MNTTDSLLDTTDLDPYLYYESQRAKGEVVWDEQMNAWVVTSLETARQVLRGDKTLFNHAMQSLDPKFVNIIVGGPSIVMMNGDRHTKMHQWYIKALSPTLVDSWRATRIQPVAANLVDRIAPRGHAELMEEICEQIPSRIIAATIGLEWRDDALIKQIRAVMKRLVLFLNDLFTKDQAILDGAIAASEEFGQILLPAVRERVDGKGDDLISMIWRGGREMFGDWTEVDTYAHTRTMFSGADTAINALANTFYLLLQNPDWKEKVRQAITEGGAKGSSAFVEEALRMYGGIQFRIRVALEDSEVAGVKIKKGQNVAVVLGAAGRDPNAFSCPMQIDTNRANKTHHMAFFFGPRSCIGAALARATIQETITNVLMRLPDLHLNPTAPPPAFSGLAARGWSPLNVSFSPEQKQTPKSART